MNKPRFEGIFPPIVTPLDEKERIDEQGFVKQLNRLMDNGVHGFYLLGTSGEFVALSNEERKRAIEIAVKAVAGRVPIICGVMDSSTKRVIKNIEFVQELGLTFPVLLDRTGEVGYKYQLRSLPTTFFVDRQGVIQQVILGGPMSEVTLQTALESLLSEEP